MEDSKRSKKRYLITSGLPYSNGRLHTGHIAGAYLPADIYTRFLRLCGHDVRFICGSDDHGVAIMLSAMKSDKQPQEIVDYYNELQQQDFAGLQIEFDIYGSTSRNPYHVKTSQDLFLRLYNKGFFEKQRARQFYDEQKSVFLPDRFVKGECGYCGANNQNGDQCENCGKVLDVDTLLNAYSVLSNQPATIKESVHWFLDLARFEKGIKEWLSRPVIREQTRSYVNGLLTTGLVKRSMTRDIEWGIPVPLDDPEAKGKVLYVWFDAPIGYISNTMELCQKVDGDSERFREWWCTDDCKIVHFIGEDNTIFHCVIWIAMLQQSDQYKLPDFVAVNQFLNFQASGKDVEKMSKSRSAAVWIGEYLASGANPDVLRYYLTAIAPERARTVYRPDDLITRNNSDLANTLGNFVNRVVTFTHKYVGPNVPDYLEDKASDIDRKFEESISVTHRKTTELLEGYCFKAAQETIFEFARSCNRYLDEKAPWVTRKNDMDTTKVTLAHALKAIYALTVMLTPFLPLTGRKLCKILCMEPTELDWNSCCAVSLTGKPLGEAEILFEKLE